MFRLIHHLANMASGSMVVYGLSGIFTAEVNYLALPAIIIGLVWYGVNNAKELGIE